MFGVSDEAAVAKDEVELAVYAVLLVDLLPRTVDRHAEDFQPGADQRLRAPGVERYAEVGAENRRDSSCGRLRDHRDELLVEQWLAPVVELDLPQRIAELGEDPAVKGQ